MRDLPVTRHSRVSRRLSLVVLLVCGFVTASQTAVAKKKGGAISIKDLQIKKKRLPDGWMFSEKTQTKHAAPSSLFEDPDLQRLAPMPDAKDTLSFNDSTGGLTTAYLLVYQSADRALESLSLVMGYLWGIDMRPTDARPWDVIHSDNAIIIIAGDRIEAVGDFLLSEYNEDWDFSRARGEPVTLP